MTEDGPRRPQMSAAQVGREFVAHPDWRWRAGMKVWLGGGFVLCDSDSGPDAELRLMLNGANSPEFYQGDVRALYPDVTHRGTLGLIEERVGDLVPGGVWYGVDVTVRRNTEAPLFVARASLVGEVLHERKGYTRGEALLHLLYHVRPLEDARLGGARR